MDSTARHWATLFIGDMALQVGGVSDERLIYSYGLCVTLACE
jgi:hypothetical protein